MFAVRFGHPQQTLLCFYYDSNACCDVILLWRWSSNNYFYILNMNKWCGYETHITCSYSVCKNIQFYSHASTFILATCMSYVPMALNKSTQFYKRYCSAATLWRHNMHCYRNRNIIKSAEEGRWPKLRPTHSVFIVINIH